MSSDSAFDPVFEDIQEQSVAKRQRLEEPTNSQVTKEMSSEVSMDKFRQELHHAFATKSGVNTKNVYPCGAHDFFAKEPNINMFLLLWYMQEQEFLSLGFVLRELDPAIIPTIYSTARVVADAMTNNTEDVRVKEERILGLLQANEQLRRVLSTMIVRVSPEGTSPLHLNFHRFNGDISVVDLSQPINTSGNAQYDFLLGYRSLKKICTCPGTAQEKLRKAFVHELTIGDIESCQAMLRKSRANLMGGLDKHGSSAIHYAASFGDLAMVKSLKNSGFDTCQYNGLGETAIFSMVREIDSYKKRTFRAIIEELGSNVVVPSRTNFTVVEDLIMNLQLPDPEFHEAALHYLDVLLELKAEGFIQLDLDHQDNDGDYALGTAVYYKRFDFALKLLNAGANPCLYNNQGESAKDDLLLCEDQTVRETAIRCVREHEQRMEAASLARAATTSEAALPSLGLDLDLPPALPSEPSNFFVRGVIFDPAAAE